MRGYTPMLTRVSPWNTVLCTRSRAYTPHFRSWRQATTDQVQAEVCRSCFSDDLVFSSSQATDLKTFPNTQTNDTSVSGSLAERRPNPYSRSQTLLRGTWFAVRVARWQRGVFTTRHRASWTCILEVQGMNPTHPRTPTLSHSQKLHTDNNAETLTYTRVYTTRHALPP